MKRANAVIFSLLIVISSLAGCIGGEDFDSSSIDQQISELEKQQELMNDALNEQLLFNVQIQQALEEMNTSSADDYLNLLQVIIGIQVNVSSSQSMISSLIIELENLNSSNEDLLTQLNQTQSYLASLEYDLNNTIAELIDAIDWANQTVNWAYMDLNFVDLTGAELKGANLSYANLFSAQMNLVNLSGAKLNYAKLDGANLNFADISNADLSSAILGNADLTNASLVEANLTDAFMTNTDLTNANLFGAVLTNALLDGVTWYDTICPDGTNSNDNGNTCINNI